MCPFCAFGVIDVPKFVVFRRGHTLEICVEVCKYCSNKHFDDTNISMIYCIALGVFFFALSSLFLSLLKFFFSLFLKINVIANQVPIQYVKALIKNIHNCFPSRFILANSKPVQDSLFPIREDLEEEKIPIIFIIAIAITSHMSCESHIDTISCQYRQRLQDCGNRSSGTM